MDNFADIIIDLNNWANALREIFSNAYYRTPIVLLMLLELFLVLIAHVPIYYMFRVPRKEGKKEREKLDEESGSTRENKENPEIGMLEALKSIEQKVGEVNELTQKSLRIMGKMLETNNGTLRETLREIWDNPPDWLDRLIVRDEAAAIAETKAPDSAKKMRHGHGREPTDKADTSFLDFDDLDDQYPFDPDVQLLDLGKLVADEEPLQGQAEAQDPEQNKAPDTKGVVAEEPESAHKSNGNGTKSPV